MRIGKKSRARRTLGFYRSAFGIKQPYRVLVDGTALQAHLLCRPLAAAHMHNARRPCIRRPPPISGSTCGRSSQRCWEAAPRWS